MAWSKKDIRRTPDRNTEIVPVVRTRIFIPQSPTRPIDIHTKDLVKKEYVRTNPWWFTEHRRGIKREKLGEDPLEMRAVPKSQLKGTLPERIVYKSLVDLIKLNPNVDFTFQSSQAGGRIELGGLVADFLFPIMKIVIQVQGPTHNIFIRIKKDSEQQDLLADMGYRVFEIEDEIIYNEYRYEAWLRNLFNIGGVGGGTGNTFNVAGQATAVGALQQDISVDEGEIGDEKRLNDIYDLLNDVYDIMRRSI